MLYPPGFLSLQLTFASKITQLTQRPYQETILNMTALYRILGLDWSYQFYLERANQIASYDNAHWGCFGYEYWSERQLIHLHFGNLDGSGYGPVSHQRKEARLADLRSMFTHIKRMKPDAIAVHGSSWLYNLEAYRRLFPVEYGLSARTDAPRPIARSLWGQFLHYDERLNEERATMFLDRLERSIQLNVSRCIQTGWASSVNHRNLDVSTFWSTTPVSISANLLKSWMRPVGIWFKIPI